MEDNSEQDTGIINRIKESPRTVSALIIILIVAAAIYAFSGNKQESTPEEVAENVQAEETTAPADEDNKVGEVAGEKTTTPEPVSEEKLKAEEKTMPEATRSAEGYVEIAQAGNGLTHLARRATTRWLNENQAGYSVTNEHRIYIEDYIQKKMGTTGLKLGDSKTVSYDLIAEAVSTAGQLNAGQLNNLSQYTSVL